MSNNVTDKVMEIEPGPVEIRFRPDGGSADLVGYALVMLGDNKVYSWYFVMKKGVQFPLPNNLGDESCFKGIEAPNSSPDEFYEWVMKQGTLGDEVETSKAEETYGAWNP